MEFRGYQGTYVPRCRRSTRRRCSSEHDSFYRLLLKACAPTRPTASSPPTSCACSCSACCARSSAAGREGAAEHSTSSLLFECHGLRRRARLAGPAPAAHRRERPAGAVAAHRQHRRPGATTGRPGGRPRDQPRGAAGPVARRPRGRAARAGRRRRRGRCWPRTPGSGAPPGCRGWSPWPAGRRPRRRARSTRSTGRCPASWRRSWRWPSPARPAATPTWPSRSTWCAPAPMPTTSPRSLRAGPDPLGPRRRRRCGRARSTWCPVTSRAFTPAAGAGPGCSPSRVAACPRWPRRCDSIDNLTIDPVDRSRFRVEVLTRRWGWSSRTAPTPRCHRRAPCFRAGPARRARGGLPRARRPRAPAARSGSRLVDRANAVRRWTLR